MLVLRTIIRRNLTINVSPGTFDSRHKKQAIASVESTIQYNTTCKYMYLTPLYSLFQSQRIKCYTRQATPTTQCVAAVRKFTGH